MNQRQLPHPRLLGHRVRATGGLPGTPRRQNHGSGDATGEEVHREHSHNSDADGRSKIDVKQPRRQIKFVREGQVFKKVLSFDLVYP